MSLYSKKIRIIFTLFFFLSSLQFTGCASNGVYTSSGNKIYDVDAAFKNGDIRLTCGLGCSGNNGYNRPKMKKLYNDGDWYTLMLTITNIGFSSDLNYYYLGRSAENFSYFEAAKIYYNLARTAFKCNGSINNCDGFEFPNNLLNRENIIRISFENTKKKDNHNNITSGSVSFDQDSTREIKLEKNLPIVIPEIELKPNPVTGKLE